MPFETPEMMEGTIRETGGVPVTFGGTQTWCHRENYDPRVRDLFTNVRGKADVLIGPRARFSGIADDATIYVGAVDDGVATPAWVAIVAALGWPTTGDLDDMRVGDWELLEEGLVIAIALKPAPPAP